MDAIIAPNPMPIKSQPAQPECRRIPEELSASEVIARAEERFGWEAVLQASSFVASSQGKDRLAEALNRLAEEERR